jgi:hypothetical protein
LAAGVDDGVLIRERAQAQEALSEMEPKAFDRIELGAGGRRRDQGDVVRDLKGVGATPAGLVERHDGALVFRRGFGELGEEGRPRTIDRAGASALGGMSPNASPVSGATAPKTQAHLKRLSQRPGGRRPFRRPFRRQR